MSKALRKLAPVVTAAALVAAFFTVLFSAASCSSPRQPVAPQTVDAPRTPVTIDSKMADWVAVPNAHQNYGWTADGLLKYTFQLQNRTDHQFWFLYKTTFVDASGVTPVDQQLARRQPLGPAETATITVVSGNPAAKKVRIQILK